jgi:excisionase family DNA binding protein
MATGDFDEPFLTVAEVAEILRLNPQTVRNWIDAGSLPAIHVGRRVRIKRADLDRILENGYRGTSGATPPGSGPDAHDFWGGEPVGAVEASSEPTANGAEGAEDGQ